MKCPHCGHVPFSFFGGDSTDGFHECGKCHKVYQVRIKRQVRKVETTEWVY